MMRAGQEPQKHHPRKEAQNHQDKAEDDNLDLRLRLRRNAICRPDNRDHRRTVWGVIDPTDSTSVFAANNGMKIALVARNRKHEGGHSPGELRGKPHPKKFKTQICRIKHLEL